MMEQERWLPVKGFEGDYEVSSFGRVRSLDSVVKGRIGFMRKRPGKVLKDKCSGGRQVVCLTGKRTVAVPGLVAAAFLEDAPRHDSQVIHIDFNVKNNRADNLEWASPKEKAEHSRRAGHFCPVANPKQRRKLTKEQVVEIRSLVEQGVAQNAIAEKFGLSGSAVSMIKKRKIWVNA